jgi:PKD repeat protein
VKRIRYTAGNGAPTAVATASPSSGAAPLTVQFDGTRSTDPDPGDTLTYAWDLDGDSAFDDSTASTPSFTYTFGSWSDGGAATHNITAAGSATYTATYAAG